MSPAVHPEAGDVQDRKSVVQGKSVDLGVTGVQTCALPISPSGFSTRVESALPRALYQARVARPFGAWVTVVSAGKRASVRQASAESPSAFRVLYGCPQRSTQKRVTSKIARASCRERV